MTWQYAGAYLVSIVTSPVLLAAFVLGVVTGCGGRMAWTRRR